MAGERCKNIQIEILRRSPIRNKAGLSRKRDKVEMKDMEQEIEEFVDHTYIGLITLEL